MGHYKKVLHMIVKTCKTDNGWHKQGLLHYSLRSCLHQYRQTALLTLLPIIHRSRFRYIMSNPQQETAVKSQPWQNKLMKSIKHPLVPLKLALLFYDGGKHVLLTFKTKINIIAEQDGHSICLT